MALVTVYNVSTGIQEGDYSAYICCTICEALLFMLLCCQLSGIAQQRYTDSLYNIVHDDHTDNITRILALSHLARMVRFYDEPRALQLAEEAASYKIYAYAGRSGFS